MGGCGCLSAMEEPENKGRKYAMGLPQGGDELDENELLSSIGQNKLNLSQTVILRFEGVNLPNLDKSSNSDPFLVLYQISNMKNRRL